MIVGDLQSSANTHIITNAVYAINLIDINIPAHTVRFRNSHYGKKKPRTRRGLLIGFSLIRLGWCHQHKSNRRTQDAQSSWRNESLRPGEA